MHSLTHQVGLVLEGVVQVGDPPPVAPDEDVPLLLEARGLRPLQHLPLVEDLEGEHAVCLAQLDHAHLAEGAPTDHLQDLEVVFAQAHGLHSVRHGFHWKLNRRRMN